MFYALDNGELSTEQKRGIITLIPKKETDRSVLKNWRPITLLNVDYKILTKALAKRLTFYLPKLVSSDQTGYIKGRYIGTNIRTIEDIIKFVNETDMSGYLLAVDFHKDFGSVKWTAIIQALKLYGIGEHNFSELGVYNLQKHINLCW